MYERDKSDITIRNYHQILTQTADRD